jgi:two-component system sensor kinase FixL
MATTRTAPAPAPRDDPAADAMTIAAPNPFGGALAWAAVVVAYVALDAASFLFPYQALPVTPWNPQAGLAIAVAMAFGRPIASAVITATTASELLLRAGGVSLTLNLAAAVALACTYLGIGAVARRLAHGIDLARLAALRGFLVASLVGTAIGAAAYVAVHASALGSDVRVPLEPFLRMWLGDFVGTVATAPLLLLGFARRGRSVDPRRMRAWAIDAALFIAAVGALLALIFGYEPIEGHKLFYLLFVPLIALAVRHDFAGAAIGNVLLQIALIVTLVLTHRTAEAATEYQMLMLVLAVTTLMLGAVASERNRARILLAAQGARLRAQQAALADALRVAAASEMASTMAHELSQPLSAIGTYARAGLEMLRRGTGSSAEIATALERVEQETLRSNEAVRRIRDFFRSGVSRLEPATVSTLVQDAAGAVRDRVEARGVYLQTEVAPELPAVLVDRIQIGTVLNNLILNALDAVAESPAAAFVRIRAHREGPAAVAIDVEDSGPGIPESIRHLLFEPLATTKPAGMGLGLAISRTIVQAHGGRLWLLGERPTCFRFTLPAHADDAD